MPPSEPAGAGWLARGQYELEERRQLGDLSRLAGELATLSAPRPHGRDLALAAEPHPQQRLQELVERRHLLDREPVDDDLPVSRAAR